MSRRDEDSLIEGYKERDAVKILEILNE